MKSLLPRRVGVRDFPFLLALVPHVPAGEAAKDEQYEEDPEAGVARFAVRVRVKLRLTDEISDRAGAGLLPPITELAVVHDEASPTARLREPVLREGLRVDPPGVARLLHLVVTDEDVPSPGELILYGKKQPYLMDGDVA